MSVDVASGILSNTYRDARLAGRPPLVFIRSYSSALVEREGILGRGWSSSFDYKLVATVDGHRLEAPGGTSIAFDDPAGILEQGGAVRNRGAFHELRRIDGGLVVTRWSAEGGGPSRLSFPHVTFGQSVAPTRFEDETGEIVDLVWDRRGLLSSAEQRRSARRLELAYRGLRLDQVTAVSQGARRVLASYEYDPRGLLQSFTDALGNTATYRYDERGRLEQEVARDGSVWRFAFDGEGRCVRTTGQDGYDEKTLAYDLAGHTTRVTDSRGSVWSHHWNDAGQVVRSETPLGRVSQSVFDDMGRLVKAIGPTGAAHAFAYDDAGHRSSITDPKGLVTQFEHDDAHRLVRFVDKAGHEWRRQFAGARVVEIVDPVGAAFHFTWSERGDLERVDGPAGLVRRYFWTPTGELAAFADASEAAFHYRHDEWGQLTSSRDPMGGVTQRSRDARGLLTSVTWADGTMTRNEYTPSGALSRTIDRDGSVRTYRVSACSGRWGAIEHANRTFRFRWENEPSLLTEIQNPNGELRQFEYDDDLRLTREIAYDGIETSYHYDAEGRLGARTVGSETTTFERDVTGAIVKASYPDGAVVDLQYDDLGRLAKIADAASTIAFERDAYGRPLVEDAGAFQVTRTFDALGRLTTRKTSLGFETTSELDGAGRPRALTIAGRRVELSYDALGREVERRFDGGATLHSSWDAVQRLVEQRMTLPVPAGGRHGHASASVPPPVHRRYAYGPADKLLSVEDGRWARSAYVYDVAGRLTEAQTGDVASERYSYDAAGNLTATASGHPGRPAERWTETRRVIGPGGRLEAEGGLGFRYDGAGRVIGMTAGDAGPTWSYRWDARGRLVEVRLPNGDSHRYGYDALDRRVFKEGPAGRTEYRWDGDRLTHEIDGAGAVQSWELASGNLAPVAKVDGGEVYFAVTDHIGAPRELTTGEGRIAWSALLSPRGSIAAKGEQGIDCKLRLPGQWWDEETSLSYNRFRYYSPARSQFLSRDPLSRLLDFNAYAYPNDPLFWIDPLGLLSEVLHNTPDQVMGPNGPVTRPQGGTALVTPADVGTPTNPTGSDANPAIRPPGFEGGGHPDHHERGHLIPKLLGGDGNDPRNLVTITGGTNDPGMQNVEQRIADHVRSGEGNYVDLEVTPLYHGDELVPHSVRIRATDLATGETIVDETVENGLHKNYRACSH